STEWSHSINLGSEGSSDVNFTYPSGVAVSADTLTAWVADYSNNRISVWIRTSDTSTNWSHSSNFGTSGNGDANFDRPIGVAVSPNGRTVWGADLFNSRISVWTRPTNTSTDWSHSINFGGQGTEDYNFGGPTGVAVSANGRTVWVSDSANNRISIWTYS
ncbi:MAG: hypothetical protein ACKOCK_02270, partial [Chloroflexota bacterium]